jgi:hypothetical protein
MKKKIIFGLIATTGKFIKGLVLFASFILFGCSYPTSYNVIKEKHMEIKVEQLVKEQK